MAKPSTKSQLLEAAATERASLERFLAGLSREEVERPGADGCPSVKDTLAHIVAWEQMVVGWLAAGERGESPSVPAEGFKWSQLPALNEQIRAAWAPIPLEEVRARFSASYAETMAEIERLSEAELFAPGRWPWMNRNTLAAYFGSCTASHYRWALTETRRALAKDTATR